MQILCLGCTGFVGSAVRERLLEAGHQLLVVSRTMPRTSHRRESYISFDSDWMEHLGKVDAIVNFAGEPIADSIWTDARQRMIRDSRAGLCHRILDRLSRVSKVPRVWVNASAVGFYGDRGDELLTEDQKAGTGFLASVCREWESPVEQASRLGIREVRLRLGNVLGPRGGVLPVWKKIFSYGLGGAWGTGLQYMPWVHRQDVAEVVSWALESKGKGPFNVVAPGIVMQHEFAETIARLLSCKIRFRTPAWALRALLWGRSELLLSSQHVVPQNLQNAGFRFRFPELEEALRDCL